MDKRKILLFSFIGLMLLTGMLPELGLQVVAPIRSETESRQETSEIASSKKDHQSIDFFPDLNLSALIFSLDSSNSLITVLESKHTAFCVYFLSSLFNHSPPTL